MRALDPEVADVIWQTVEPLPPPPDRSHPLGCHRPKASDRLCFRGLLIRLVTGSSWVDIEAILEHQVSDTTLRARRDEWIAAGVFETASSAAAPTAATDTDTPPSASPPPCSSSAASSNTSTLGPPSRASNGSVRRRRRRRSGPTSAWASPCD
jgi:transposase